MLEGPITLIPALWNLLADSIMTYSLDDRSTIHTVRFERTWKQ